MFFVILIILSIFINFVLSKLTEPAKKPIILPIALQSSYLLLSLIGGAFVFMVFGTSFDAFDYADKILVIVGLVWLYKSPSYPPVILLTIMHLAVSIINLYYTLPLIEVALGASYSNQIFTLVTHSLFRLIVIWLMFSRVKLLEKKH